MTDKPQREYNSRDETDDEVEKGHLYLSRHRRRSFILH